MLASHLFTLRTYLRTASDSSKIFLEYTQQSPSASILNPPAVFRSSPSTCSRSHPPITHCLYRPSNDHGSVSYTISIAKSNDSASAIPFNSVSIPYKSRISISFLLSAVTASIGPLRRWCGLLCYLVVHNQAITCPTLQNDNTQILPTEQPTCRI